eukprot:4729707-Prymnesium_polylepis.1
MQHDSPQGAKPRRPRSRTRSSSRTRRDSGAHAARSAGRPPARSRWGSKRRRTKLPIACLKIWVRSRPCPLFKKSAAAFP